MELHSLSPLHLCPAGPGRFLAQRPAQWLQPDSLGGSMWSLQTPAAPLLLLPLTQVLPSAGQPRRTPRSAEGYLCPVLAASPCSQLPEVGSGQVVRRIRREAGPPSLLTLPTTQGSSTPCPTPLHYKCSCSSAVDQSHQGRGQNAES